MTGIANAIVGLWLLPVTLFILLPLAMLVTWMAYKAVQPMLGSGRKIEEIEDETLADTGLFTKV